MALQKIENLLQFIRNHGSTCGYGNGRIAIAVPYTKFWESEKAFAKYLPQIPYVRTNDVTTVLVKPTMSAVRAVLGY